MNILKKILKCCGVILGSAVIFLLAVLLVFTIAEYRPKPKEFVITSGSANGKIVCGKPFTVLSWNTGYGALGDNADYFMDGGTMVMTADKARVIENLEGISRGIQDYRPDFIFLQEVDRKSKRSFFINEKEFFEQKLPGYESSFAANFKVLHVPAPALFGRRATGKVDGGLLTFSQVPVQRAERISLPCPFKYPIRIFNLKRCLLVNRIKVAETDKELVLINLHLEAYDAGEGKIAQTKMLRKIFDAETAKGNYVIAGGDFNQTFSSVDVTAYPTYPNRWIPGIINVRDFSGETQLRMDSTQPSCRSLDTAYAGADKTNFQFYVIDGFIVSPNIEINSLKTVNKKFRNSDHNPVLMTVTLKTD